MQAFVIFPFLSLFISSLHFGYAEDVRLSEERLARRINAFGCNLLHGVYNRSTAEDNILVSPVNAFTALALLHLGADDDTLEKLSTIMKVADVKNSTELHERLHGMISKIYSTSEDYNKPDVETILANGMFVHNDFPIKNSYIQSAKKYFYSLVKNVDFSGHAQESTDTVNEWVSKITKGHIAKFYDKPLSQSTRAVLASALYFNAKWKHVFHEDDTKTEKFNTGSAEIEVPMMSSQCDMYYVNDDALHYESVTLPYTSTGHGEYEMTVYLQHTQHGKQGSLSHLYHQLTEQNFVAKTAQRSALVHLKMPRMKFAWKKSVVDALKLKSIFESAHMAEMTTVRNVRISDMIHATEMKVDEKGTKATAGTVSEILLGSSGHTCSQGTPIMFHVDRPFLMTITHKPTQAILFSGIIRKPVE